MSIHESDTHSRVAPCRASHREGLRGLQVIVERETAPFQTKRSRHHFANHIFDRSEISESIKPESGHPDRSFLFSWLVDALVMHRVPYVK